jgi:hypothetical protein
VICNHTLVADFAELQAFVQCTDSSSNFSHSIKSPEDGIVAPVSWRLGSIAESRRAAKACPFS